MKMILVQWQFRVVDKKHFRKSQDVFQLSQVHQQRRLLLREDGMSVWVGDNIRKTCADVVAAFVGLQQLAAQ